MSSNLALVSPPQGHGDDLDARQRSIGVTKESLVSAMRANLRERLEVEAHCPGWRFDSDGRLRRVWVMDGVAMGNAMAAAVYGTRGEWRK